MNRTIFAKYFGRAFSTLASSQLSLSVKKAWREQKSLGLCGAFLGGYFGHVFLNLYKRREHWHKIDRMYDEAIKSGEELKVLAIQFEKERKDKLRELLNQNSSS
ncbi:hypothetical protein ISN45_Aa07g005190 [Arabidopsis thaliana x Arabidopsis arenosa]|uniref:Uncharacterized protein n=1 Tax=Arabidopsis thaliana x Arabidopsis arenosa TaxID=1240361 RepID=A0A8T1XZX5_9BRAS|nr:hypothetical protein ISN45_Aa07g005190 [Arabidopsis thaliana x Arabidopsis arenosa]